MAYAKDYTRIKAPALGLFAPIFFPPGADSTRAAALAQWEASMFEPYRAASIARFRREVAVSQDTLLPNTNHASIGVVDVNGVISWTPGEAQGPSTNVITTVVSDGALRATNSIGVEERKVKE